MRVWFMYDNHTFARVGDSTTPRELMEVKARMLFAEDNCGSLFARDNLDRPATDLISKPLPNGKYGVTAADLQAFFDRVEEHANWEARG